MHLRPYQKQCVDAIHGAINSGEKLIVIVIPTGGGKTVIFSQLPEKMKEIGKKTMILAHREELLEQAREKLMRISPNLKIGIEQGERTASNDCDVVIASTATIGRKESLRIKKFDPNEYGLLVLDECHHSTSDSVLNIFSHFGCNKQEGLREGCPVVLGVTATPFRGDNVGLDKVFDKVVFKYDIKDAIDEGYLADIKAYTIFTKQNLNVAVRAGDFALGELSDAVNNEERNKLIVDSYREMCDGEQAICFTVDVAHAHDLAQKFKDSGYIAESAYGSMKKDERKNIIERFSRGEIQVLTNCALFTEGFDVPNIRAVLMARPTKSRVFYLQAIGRGTRIFPDKEHVKILDFVDVCKRHSVVSSSSLIGLDKPIKARGERIMRLKEKFEELISRHPSKDVSSIEIDNLDKEIQEVNIFEIAALPEIVQSYSKNKWVSYLDGYKISLGSNDSGEKLFGEIRPNIVGKYEISFYKMKKREEVDSKDSSTYSKEVFHVISVDTSDISQALGIADKHIDMTMPEKKNLVSQSAKWNTEKATKKQVQLLRKFGYHDADKLSKGDASNLISIVLSKK